MDSSLSVIFRQIGPNSVESNTGIRIERTGRMDLRYTDKEKILVVEVEPGENLAVYTTSINGWQPPHDIIPFNLNDKKQIIENISKALQILNIEYVIV